MGIVQVGFSRLYNAGGCSLLGGKQTALRFRFGEVDVEAYVGPQPKHVVLGMKVGPPVPIDENDPHRIAREREYEVPSPEIFPAKIYTELIATQALEIEDALATAFFDRQAAARAEVLRRVAQHQVLFMHALDFVAGVIGLRLHHVLVATPVHEQCFAYRQKGEPYALSVKIRCKVTDALKLDISAGGASAARKRWPHLRANWKSEPASEVLAWLLRAWTAKDAVLKFVSLFTPLECVIPGVQKELNEWEKNRKAIHALVKEHADPLARNDLYSFVTGLRVSPQPLSERFANWATEAALPGWKSDVAAFRKFGRMRNALLHAGRSSVEFRVVVEQDDVRTLEDIVERYVCLALFGDANVYQSKKRPSRRE